MRQAIHPGVFLGGAILVCAALLWLRAPAPVIETPARGTPRPVPAERASIALDSSVLERYAGKYEGRGDLTVELALKDGKLIMESSATVPDELRATSETEFFLKNMNIEVKFDVARDGTVRGFVANTEFGVIQLKRAR